MPFLASQTPFEPESFSGQCRWEEGGGVGEEARQPLPTMTLVLVVIFRQNFVVFFPFYGRFL